MSALKPYIKDYTTDEIGELGMKYHALRKEGRYEEASIVLKEIPLLPWLANMEKEARGIRALIESGSNLSKAVKEYGEEWLKE